MENMENFKFVCDVDKLSDSEGKRFLINDVDIAVFKINEEIFAVSNICPHQQASMIHEGFVENGCVVCPLHGWTFNLKSGNLHSGSKGLDIYPIKIVDGKIYAKVVAKEINW
jgi:NAD(P)H-dependent nitrite reductase small subunit